jgi:hypothetical protein
MGFFRIFALYIPDRFPYDEVANRETASQMHARGAFSLGESRESQGATWQIIE